MMSLGFGFGSRLVRGLTQKSCKNFTITDSRENHGTLS